ncbi:hypothetical protein AB0G15_29555 [Streptosporangium sp. NPDC023825]|uniref:hypothetical protein n=1 Tax=Streptosporangium sp. NPDC023825 TaxID=3154909 RepID=UPI0034408F44
MGDETAWWKTFVAEVLGPRGVPAETMFAEPDPWTSNTVGVLAPETSSFDLDAEEELAGQDDSEADDKGHPRSLFLVVWLRMAHCPL